MRIIRNYDECKNIENLVVTVGTFDGVHLGHKKILQKVKSIAKEINGQSMIVTFQPHPRKIIFPNETDLKLINTYEEKLQLFEQHEIDNVLIIDFTLNFSRKSSMDFIKEILAGKLGIKYIVIGFNHHFGFGRNGSLRQLIEAGKYYKFKVEEIPQEIIDNTIVSSTAIRKAIFNADFTTANKLLGYPFFITGKVIEGIKIGRLIGYPTANIENPPDYKILPPDGVYAVKVKLHNTMFNAMLYIGNRPTFNGKTKTIEVNIFELNENLYNKELTIMFLKKIRDDIKFENTEQLIKQIENDKKNVIEFFNSNNPSKSI